MAGLARSRLLLFRGVTIALSPGFEHARLFFLLFGKEGGETKSEGENEVLVHGDDRLGYWDSSVEAEFSPARAARKVCQASVAHLRRAG